VSDAHEFSLMKTILKAVALLAAVTCVVWIAVIWHWQVTHRDMSADDLVLYLVVLPLVVFALSVALRWAVRGALSRQGEAGAAPVAAGSPESDHGTTQQAAEGRERSLAWPVLGAWILGPAGDDVSALIEAARAGKPGPVPDRELRNSKGLPVLCARAAAIDTAPLEQAWQEWRQRQVSTALRVPQPQVVRALSALRGAMACAADGLLEWLQSMAQERRCLARVRVLAAWPEGWTEQDRAWTESWLRDSLLDLAGDALPGEHWLLQHLPACSGAQAWQHVDQLLLALERELCDDVVLLLACHSEVNETAVDVLERSGRLFCADRHPKGLMPGEGAAAILLARAGAHQQAKAREAMAWLHRPAWARREKSVDAPGRTSAEVACGAVADAIAMAGIDAAEVAALCSDADRHSPRATELFGTTIELLPGLDPVEDMRLLGVVQGHASQTGALWAVAGAALLAREAERPALALSLADPHWRMALVARHAPAASSATAANA
jgi:hypothetical protein